MKATVYKTSKDNGARYLLGSPGENTLVVIGVNPSTATDTEFDPTIRKIIGFSNKHNFDGWFTLNVYPQRATDPVNLDTRENRIFHEENLNEVRRVLESLVGKDVTVWAAWGNLIETRGYLKNCLRDLSDVMKAYNPRWIALGEPTKNGHPKHPSRLSYQEKLRTFDIEEYLR